MISVFSLTLLKNILPKFDMKTSLGELETEVILNTQIMKNFGGRSPAMPPVYK